MKGHTTGQQWDLTASCLLGSYQFVYPSLQFQLEEIPLYEKQKQNANCRNSSKIHRKTRTKRIDTLSTFLSCHRHFIKRGRVKL